VHGKKKNVKKSTCMVHLIYHFR